MTRSEALYGSNTRSGVNLLHPTAKLAWYRARAAKLEDMTGRDVPFAKLMTAERIRMIEVIEGVAMLQLTA